MGEDWDSWAKITRSCILTSKKPLTVQEISRDTKMLEGKEIPYRQFGCRTLEEMLRKIPDLNVFQQNGQIVVEAKASEKTAHIKRFVKLQKSSKKKPRTLPPVFNRNRRPPMNRPKNRPNVPNNNYFRPNSAEPQRRPSMGQHQFSYPTPPTTPTPQMRKTPPPPPLMQVPIPPPQWRTSPPPAVQKNVHFAPKPTIQEIPPRVSPPPVVSPPPRVSPTQRISPPQRVSPPPPPQKSSAPKPSSVANRLNIAPTSIPRQVPIPVLDDPRLTLMNYAEARNLALPVYKDLPMKNKIFFSSVTVNSKKYSSYPKEAKTKEEAEKLAAQAALDELLGKDNQPLIETKDKHLIIKRILSIVNDHPNGMFESSIVESYIAKYNQGLPKDWLKLVEQSLNVDVGANKLVILSPQIQTGSSNIHTLVPKITEPETLNLNDMEEFWLHIYVVYSTTDIWGVIIDESYSDKIDELAKDMKAHYGNDSVSSTTVSPGKYYAVFDSEWHRVRCIKVDQDKNNATVFFIDRGDEDVFAVSRLHKLESKFCLLPAQSVCISMTDLEIFDDCEGTEKLMEDLLVDKNVFVQNMKFDQRYSEGRYISTVTAQLYLKGDDDTTINANELLRDEILKKVVDPTTYIALDKCAQEVHISHVSEKAIYVQMKSKGLKYLNMLMHDLTKDYLDNIYFKLRPVDRLNDKKIYVTKNKNDWCRVKIINIINDDTANVLCIDIGCTLKIVRKDLVLLEDLSELLNLYPSQALQIKLHKISPIMFDKKMADHLCVLAPKTSVFYMKVVGGVDNIPVVEFYKRTENNFLASLNDTLALEPEITSKDDNNNAKPRIRNDRSIILRSEFPLKAPNIPPIGSYFDVHITMAAHPGNFTVQPLGSVHELDILMNEITRVCESYTGPPIAPNNIKVGNMYAVKYDDDGRWYRAYVSKVISKSVCAVYFCDFGDYRAVSPEQLQPLQIQFYDLPYQAIKAKLYGITPKLKGDWTVKDSVRFNELTVDKRFVSIIKSCDIDRSSSSETILGLELIDTSTPDDIFITDILVNENRAEKLEEL